MTDDTLHHAYLAGILDGEGCISASNVSYLHFSVGVQMVKDDVLKWLETRYGGKIYPANDPRFLEPMSQWLVSGRACIPVLEAALPYLVLKQN